MSAGVGAEHRSPAGWKGIGAPARERAGKPLPGVRNSEVEPPFAAGRGRLLRRAAPPRFSVHGRRQASGAVTPRGRAAPAASYGSGVTTTGFDRAAASPGPEAPARRADGPEGTPTAKYAARRPRWTPRSPFRPRVLPNPRRLMPLSRSSSSSYRSTSAFRTRMLPPFPYGTPPPRQFEPALGQKRSTCHAERKDRRGRLEHQRTAPGQASPENLRRPRYASRSGHGEGAPPARRGRRGAAAPPRRRPRRARNAAKASCAMTPRRSHQIALLRMKQHHQGIEVNFVNDVGRRLSLPPPTPARC